MDPTSLPTDNLYKFLALGGALGACVVWLGITRKMDKLIERKAQLVAEQAKLQLAIQHIAKEGAAYDEKQHEERMGASRELALKDVELSKAIEAYNYFEKSGEGTATKALLVILLLVAVSVAGFGLWYCRVQVHLDKQIVDAQREQRARAELAELDLRRAKITPTPSASTAPP